MNYRAYLHPVVFGEGSEVSSSKSFEEIVQRRYSRREILETVAKQGTGAAFVVGLGASLSGCGEAAEEPGGQVSSGLTFEEIPHGFDQDHHVSPGYSADVLIRWGDPLFADSPIFDPEAQTAEAQARQFGYNNDYIAYMPLPKGSENSDHGLLCVNHEYASSHLMHPGLGTMREALGKLEERHVKINMNGHGLSVVEVKKEGGKWSTVVGSATNRRYVIDTEYEVTGPAAGHKRMQTVADPDGRTILGTLNNCAGGFTPWGTVLTAEENFNYYFYGDRQKAVEGAPEEARNLAAYKIGFDKSRPENDAPFAQPWARVDDRFDIAANPREPNRFGWIVEYDPYDPSSTPKKRTAMGRFKHEGANIIAEDGKPIVAYMGDDQKNQFVYKFVSRGIFDASDMSANRDLLEEGDLYAARFNEDGSGVWLKLSLEDERLSGPEAGFADHADVLIEARVAADLLGATPMDRPEDIETSPITGRTYVSLTNNTSRGLTETDAANPRTRNIWGHIIEMAAPGADGARDHWVDHFGWEMFIMGGDPDHLLPLAKGQYHEATSENGWFQNPDNLAFDPKGRLWIATDGFSGTNIRATGRVPVHDGLWACETTGDGRALTKHFYGCPSGAELCGPFFTPDGTTLFVAVQHPGSDGKSVSDDKASYAEPSTRWPDFRDDMPPRPSIVAITKDDDGEIGC